MQRQSSFRLGSFLLAIVMSLHGNRSLATAALESTQPASPEAAACPANAQWINSLKPNGEAGPELLLAENGKALYRIVVRAGADGQERLAADKLRDYLSQMTRAEFALVEEGNDFHPSGQEISVGRTRLLERAAPVQLKADLGEDGYAVATQDQQLFVFGQTPGGTLNGVYCLLEEDLGCRWYSTKFKPMIPSQPSLRFRPVQRAYKPALDHLRDVYYNDARGDTDTAKEWTRANRLEDISAVGNAWGFSHTYAGLVPPSTYFAKHPEYYSEIDGKRVPRQLCLTNPDLEGIILKQVLDHHKANPEMRFYEISPNDGRNYCQCRKCQAVNKAAGGTEMGTLLRLINRVAAKVEKVYPEVRLTTLAYLETVQPPINEKPRKNVIITLCTDKATWGNPCLFVTETPEFKKGLKAWEEAGANLRIWDYTVVFQNNMQPLLNMPVVSDNLRYYVRHGVKGVFMEGVHSRNDGADRSIIRSWVWLKQLWDPSRDTRELVRDFNYGFYGPAAEPMQAYDEMLWRKWDRHHMNFLTLDECLDYFILFNKPFLDQAWPLLNQAERLAGGDKELLARVRLAKLPVQYLSLNCGPGQDSAGYRQMLDQFSQTAKDNNVQFIENQFTGKDREQIIAVWEGLAQGKPVGIETTELGTQWWFRYDTTNAGEEQQWQDPKTPQSEWAQIGPGSVLAGDKPGWAWLRATVDVPANLPNSAHCMFYAPALSGDIEVYIDGKKMAVERTARATGLEPAELENLPLVLEYHGRHLTPGQHATVVLRMACPRGLKSSWRPVYLVSAPTQLSASALEQVVQKR